MRRLAGPALLTAALMAPTAASAAWSATAAGSAPVSAATLAGPGSTTLTWDPTVHVTWTASPSTWASGYRVLRGVSPTALSQLGADHAAPTTVDDSPGAGTHYYAVVAYRDGWTSPLGTVLARDDRNYVLTGAAPTNGTTGCATASSITGMRQGFPLTGTGVSPTLGATTYSLCTETWTAGQSLPAGATTATAYVANTSNKSACSVGITVTGGTTALGNATVSIPPGQTAATPMTWSVTTSAHAFVTGERLTVTLTPGGGQGCNNTTLRAASSTYPSKVTLTA